MRRVFLRVGALVALCAVVLVGSSSSKDDFRLSGNMDVLFNIFKSVATMYVDPIDSEKMLREAADAMLSSLDPYTEFIPKSEVAEFKEMTTRKYGGVGSVIYASIDSSGYVRILTPYRGAPIDRAGIKPGDFIVSIDGVSMKGADIADVSSALKGEPGTEFKLVVSSPKMGGEREVVIKREIISIPAVTYAGFVGESTGYISLESFSEGCAQHVRHAIEDLKATGNLKSLILDLRDNGGGIMGEAISIVSLFVPHGSPVLSSKGRIEADNISFSTTSSPIAEDLPLAVMVNSSSASASEIVAGALQDLDRAVIIGQRTFGKGLIQTPREVGFGNMIKVTTAKYYIPSGRCIQALDYSHRNEDGSVGTIPDSLISEFATMGGRKVYDGGGITPDVTLEQRQFRGLPYSATLMKYLDNFSLDYYAEHEEVPDIRTFKFSDKEFEDFKTYVEGRDIEFKSYFEYNFDHLEAAAKREPYYSEIEDEIARIRSKIEGDKSDYLKLYRDDIIQYLELAIINRYHYSEGYAERYATVVDDDVDRAVEILEDQERYGKLLSVE